LPIQGQPLHCSEGFPSLTFPENSRVPRRYAIGLWLTAASLAFLFCFYHLSATFVDGGFLPADHDSFYHARRIIDALGDPLRMAQFDARIHAPEGSWITWPWAYDTLMACIARALMALTGAADPMTVLAFVAPAWVFVNAALFLGIASRLGLSLATQALAMAFFAFSPMTQTLHRVAMLDHHYVEYTFVLASLYLGLGWLADLSSRRRAIALAAVLGAAPAFHNGLFILQLPVLATFAWLWAAKRPLDRPAVLAFALTLVATTAAFLAPSEPFWRGDFSYYLHSVFHLYVACCTALLCVLASVVRAGPAAAAGLCGVLIAMAAPTVPQLLLGRDFLFAKLPYLEKIGELGSIPRDIAGGEWWRLTLSYSPLLWLLPLGIGWLFWRLRRDASNASIYFLVQVLIGSFLMLQTFRLHYFGTFALILPICRLIDDLRELRPALFASRARSLAMGALAVAPLLPGLLGLQVGHPLGTDFHYVLLRDIYPPLSAACRKAPGVVLAEHNNGHYIRYHSECSVIGDNFITTPQHVEKIRISEDLLAGSFADVLRHAPYVRYILVARAGNVFDDPRDCGVRCPENDGLRRELLEGQPPPQPRLRLLAELRFDEKGKLVPLARLFEILPP
jgi:hypothetical protein